MSVYCTNCTYESGGIYAVDLVADTHLLDVVTDHGLNPVSPTPVRPVQAVHGNYEEEVLSTEPFRARFTFTVGDEHLTLEVDDDLQVVDATREPAD